MSVSPQIRIDDDVYDFLKQKAEPFADTPNSVLRRLLGIDSEKSVPGKTSQPDAIQGPSGTASREALVQQAYQVPVLESLVRQGGSASVSNVMVDIEQALRDKLGSEDWGRLKTGGTRWKNRVQWARLDLVDRGLLERNSPHGTWVISQAGRAFLKAAGKVPD